MIVKRFEAVDMQEALKLIKSEMGSNAVILSTKSIRKGGGSFGLFGRPLIEVTAAIDNDKKIAAKNEDSKVRKPDPYFSYISSLLSPIKDDINDLKEIMGKNPPSPPFNKGEMGGLKDEVAELKSMMGFIIKHSGMAEDFAIAPEYLIPYQRMLSNGINEKYASDLIDKAQDARGNIQDENLIIDRLADEIMKSVKTNGSISDEKGGRKVIAFIGPTGVGKTTTIAKIAAAETFNKKKVAIITVDTYRIAAIEQIKIYAKIIGIPVDVVLTPEELRVTIEMHRDKDVILIDTAGRSHKNDTQLLEVSEFFNPLSRFCDSGEMETHLVLGANADERNIEDTIDRFKAVTNIDRLLFTKLDEAGIFGVIYNQSLRTGIPLSYFTTGQKVPEDIEAATSERVADLILQLSK
ncbi:MAG: flagellar biosynthesis protein FlhF [Nitrospinae bacterium]|nr:flagellar biosynthesis protein FlhF [Nitrospinota bacterium]